MRRLCRFGALLALMLAGAIATAVPLRFAAAVDDTSLGTDPGLAFFMVDVLAAQDRADDAQSLRRALWQRQLARMRGKPFVDEPRVGQAIAQGRELPATEAGFEDSWREAYNASAKLAYRAPQQAGELPQAFAQSKGWQPQGGGLWTQPQPGGGLRFLLALTLEATKLPLPLQQLQLRFGSAERGLTLQCQASLPGQAGEEGPTLQLHQTAELACDGLGEARWQMLLPTVLGAARTGGEAPLLLPQAGTAAPDAERQLWRRWDPAFDEQLARWQQATALSKRPANAADRWLASPRRLAPPEALDTAPAAKRSPVRPAARPADIWADLRLRLMVSGLALALFAVGRLALRQASPSARNMATVGLGVLVAVPVLSTVWGPGKLNGDGWANLGVVVGGLALAIGVGAAVIVALLMHRLHDLLDKDGQTWPGVIASGWRQALWMFGQATKGEFWGFVLFAAWTWALVVPLGRPWTGIVGLALFVPLCSLAWRRALSLTRAEIGVGLAVFVTMVLDLILRHHT
ncbi:hypothetical protein ACS5PN_30775 [Roseateles sp. NT4]|uniref:hypothetical protein n=1 Tax=Roseateles sp. NT4 TaxID=3453715 RepID=UPI003EEBC107